MSKGGRLWLCVAAASCLALGLGLALSPPRPHARVGAPAAVLLGAAAGAALFAAAARRLPALRARDLRARVLFARNGLLCLCAANEEVLWRRVVLGELLVAGPLAALAASSVAFGLAHRRSRVLHVATGAAFGGLYLATGALAASLAAHWTYNTLVASHVAGEPP